MKILKIKKSQKVTKVAGILSSSAKVKKKPFVEVFINKKIAIWYDKHKCPKCQCRLRTDFNLIFCSYVKCDWYEAYIKEIEE